mgnify:CR=1 FL=1
MTQLRMARLAPQKASAGNALLNAYYLKIKGTAAPAGQTFSKLLIDNIDQLQLIIGTKDACFALAGALRLAAGKQSYAYSVRPRWPLSELIAPAR